MRYDPFEMSRTRGALGTMHVVSAAVAACALMTSGVVLAQDDAAAVRLFDEGRAAMERGDLDAACDRFRRSDTESPAAGAKLNLANCEEQRGRLASAWTLFHVALQALAPDDERRAVARQHIAALTPRVPRLTVVLAPGASANTRVRIGNVDVPPTSLGVSLPLDPGTYPVVVTSVSGASRAFSVTLTEGSREVRVAIPPKGEAPPPSNVGASPPAAPRDETPGPSDTRPLGYALGGVGVAGLLTGTIAGIVALNHKSTRDDHCNADKICDQTGVDANDAYGTMATVSNIGWAVGLLGLGAGAYFVLTSDARDGSETAVRTSMGPAGSTVTMVRRW
jgi:hypothetical protein